MAIEPGQFLSHYRLDEKIGEGGMGVVYRARDEKLRRDVALKVLPAKLVENAELRQRLLREARAAAAVNHPNIATVYEVDEADGVLFIAMELIEGQTLSRRLGGRALPIPDALRIAGQIADGLARAHEAGVIHRDLKPDNVVTQADDHVKILDFGLAKVVEGNRGIVRRATDPTAATALSELTQERTLLGTPTYMSPEQARGETVDARSDVFSFGSVLYEMVTGEPPFRGQSLVETLGAIMHVNPKSASQLNPDVPSALERILERCLEKDPRDRYQRTAELVEELKSLQQSTTRGRRSARWLALAGAVVASVVIVAFWMYGRAPPPPRASRIASLAVLPFASHASGPEKEYFADAMTDLMIATLGSIDELRVIGQFSSMTYKDTELTLREIGQELKVDALVEGSVMWAENSVRITAQLIDADTSEQLWASSYQGDPRNILQLQGDVATAIAGEIQLKLTPQVEARLRPTRQVEPEAFELYLMGRQLRDKQTPEDWQRALKFFERALEIDPTLAEAHAGMARVYGLLLGKDLLPRSTTAPKIRAAVRKALELDETLAEAHVHRAFALLWLDWDWRAAGNAIRKALELNPSSAEARLAYAWYLLLSGEDDEALRQVEASRETEPWKEVYTEMHATFLHISGRHEEALELLERATDFEPDHPRWYYVRGLVYARLGEPARSIEQFRQIRREPRMLPDERSGLGYAYALAGRRDEAEEILEELGQEAVKGEAQFYHLALIACGLGDYDRAFDWLELAYRRHEIFMPVLYLEPLWDPLRSDPRYRDLLERMDLPIE